jgi:YVTN family beta-propeller protein
MKRFLWACAAAAICSAASNGYHVLKTIPIGGEGGWDYVAVDAGSRRAFVSHATHVVVVDIDSGKVTGDIPDTPGVHGIALAPVLQKGFISNGRANTVTVFDLKTLKQTGTVRTGQNPDAITFDPRTKRVFTFNGRSKDASIIDAATSRVVGTIPLGGRPEFAVNDGHGRIYVNVEDTAEIAEIDVMAMKVTKRYRLAGCEEPSGLAMDTAKRRLFSVCANKLMIISSPDTAKVLATVPIGADSDGAGFDAERNLAFSSNGEGTLTVVGETGGKYSVVDTVPTERGARTMVIDSKTHHILLPAAEFVRQPSGTQKQRPAAMPNSFRILVVGR